MRTGDFNQRVTFYRGQRVALNGGFTQTFIAIASMAGRHPAQVELLGGREAVRSEHVEASRRGVVRVRYSVATAAITEQDRIHWDNQDRMFGIIGITPAGMQLREWIEFAVVERV